MAEGRGDELIAQDIRDKIIELNLLLREAAQSEIIVDLEVHSGSYLNSTEYQAIGINQISKRI